MADKENRHGDNVPGKFYTDSECIFCYLCSQLAPKNFKDGTDHDFVFKQPQDKDEVTECENALKHCPVDAIGNDG